MNSIVLSGSFRKHWNEIAAMRVRAISLGLDVLAPIGEKISGEDESFVALDTDKDQSAQELELAYLAAIRQADALYVVCPNGYIGPSTHLEIGHALACGTPIYTSEKASEDPLESILPVQSLEAVAALLSKQSKFRVYQTGNVSEMQKQYAQTCKEHGFDKENIADIMLLLIEEIGELAETLDYSEAHESIKDILQKTQKLSHEARSVRKGVGLASESNKDHQRHDNSAGEMADVFLYLLHLANEMHVDLGQALDEKENINSARNWN